ncbi:RNA-directed DNA polymerase, eukaryota, reverse transcriptase zinc-binding domain protein [Tanacetum coccineum]|uniref:RNA-directed DNA polymerase, eukaryota, reverse transcriptase zinc-binding domain protein n=1 Tax=Tanacetum coccineum TaxID=301880 RepID=A0ABQ5B4X5_9ASTR
MHNVPIVAYSEIGLSLITNQLRKPIMLDGYTSNMCINSWGRNSYARALIEVLAKMALLNSIVVAIPFPNGKGHSMETIEIEYEWQPPRCDTCKVFDHYNNQCPKKVNVPVPDGKSDDGFMEVKRKGGKRKQQETTDGLNQPNDKTGVAAPKVDDTDIVPVRNSFQSLMEEDEIHDTNDSIWKVSHTYGDVEDDDSEEVEEVYVETDSGTQTLQNKGASTPSQGVSDVMHTCIGFKAKKREINRPWCLLGEFNASLHIDDKSEGSSYVDTAMREFQDCVEEIEVNDVNNSGLQFTWNQMPRGTNGFLKKIDRIMANLDFNEAFMGSCAVFQPYWISDHSPAILRIPTTSALKPLPFKFSNVLVHNACFKEVVFIG